MSNMARNRTLELVCRNSKKSPPVRTALYAAPTLAVSSVGITVGNGTRSSDRFSGLPNRPMPLKLARTGRLYCLCMRKLLALALPGLLLLSAAGQQQRGLERFRQLATASLDARQVFHIRDCDLDLEDLHLTLEEGTIAFLNDSVNGRPTGAYFVGEGTVLAIPPNQVERASLARFTKSAVLNERLHSVFLRFSDAQTYGALKGALRAPEPDADKFVSGWDPLIKNLSPSDALHLTALTLNNDPQRFAHALIGGDHLGVFDAIYDQAAPEAVLVV